MRTVVVHPEADREFDCLVALDRDTRFDLGEHYRHLEWLREAPPADMPRAVHIVGNAALYPFYGAGVQMFAARDTQVVVLVLLARIGSEHIQREACDRAIARMGDYFDGGG